MPENYTDAIPGTEVRFDMVYVPAAKIWIGKAEVTWDEYEAYYLTEETDAVTRPTPSYVPHDRGWGRGKRPATAISWHAAKTYCAWLARKTGRAYRLPTEAEWAAACGDSRPGWTEENSDEMTHEVGGKEPNSLGLHDMLGNVWEYCGNAEVLRGGSWREPRSEVDCAARTPVEPEWNERDPQLPRSIWWLTDGTFTGFRVARAR